MKIRSIELSNIRRFAGRRARIDGIGDGISVLSEPNEFGKSTFFDALHALFFERHRSTRAPVKSLQPHSGGAPEVQVTIDLPEGLFRLRKRWLSRATAQVHDSASRLIAQDDEAEAWLDRLMGQGLAGPSGLLWVRQGVLGLEPEGTTAADRNDREQSLTARRDLLSSVAGEIELMTGGRRMDAVLARVGEDIARIATTTLKPKADGDWKRAVDEVQKLARLRDDLAEKARNLSAELGQRSTVTRELHRLSDPLEQSAREAAINEARLAHEAALAHATRVEKARQDLQLADLTLAGSKAEILRLTGLSERITAARRASAAAIAQAKDAESSAQERQGEDAAAGAALRRAQDTVRDLRQRLTLVQKAKAAAVARVRAAQVRQTLQEAETLRGKLEHAKAARALVRTTERSVQDAEAAMATRDHLAARIEAQSATVNFVYIGPLRAERDGIAVDEDRQHITVATLFDLPGLGSLRIVPGETSGLPEADLARSEGDLAGKLAVCDAADLAQARVKLAEAHRLDGEIRTAEAVLQGIAPKGIDLLRQALAEAEAEADTAPDTTEDERDVTAELARCETAEQTSRDSAAEAHARAMATGEARAAALANRASTLNAVLTAEAESGDEAVLAVRLAERNAVLPAEQTRYDSMQMALNALVAAAPDVETTSARLARAETADLQVRRERERLGHTLSMLNGSIGALADQGIEEALDDVNGRLQNAEARARRYEAEVLALDRLRRALDEARRAARDAYFGPVLRELEPLLSILHPGAHLQIDDHSLLPTALTRDGQAEALDILSGGTREQVAILTRLAFAKLFAQDGRAVPVILDDAMVHSDDDRIEAMFTALHRVARDQQIIVLTCRQRAFAGLGGERARVVVEDL